MTTVATIISLGYDKSAAARPESIGSETELTARVGQCLREMFQILARENPYLLGTSASVSFDGSGWPRPSDALRVITVKADAGTIASPVLATGTAINIVPYDDQAFCSGSASLTELGQSFLPTGQAVDPSGGTVTIVYARAPEQPTAVTDDVDPLFPSFLDDILQCDIAAYLAYKDERTEDEQTFLALKNAGVQQMVDWARGQTYSLQQRFAQVTPPLTNTAGGRQQPVKGG